MKYIVSRQSVSLLAVLTASAGLFFFATPALAARFNWQAADVTVGVGETVSVTLFLDTQGADINAVEGTITMPENVFSFVDVYTDSSIITLWTRQPEASQQSVRFSGITPGGFEGPNGRLLSLQLVAQKVGDWQLSLPDVLVLKNDGTGQSVRTTTGFAKIHVSQEVPVSKATPKVTPTDKIAPEDFTIQITQDPTVSHNAWVAVFATQDKQSGIREYRVLETKQPLNLQTKIDTSQWQVAVGPYVLVDQSRTSFIYIAAVDRFGNLKIAHVDPSHNASWYNIPLVWYILIVLIIILVYWLTLKQKKNIHDLEAT